MQKAVRRIVVGYDGSELARRAVRAACDLVQPDGVVTVVHVYEVPWQADTYPWFKDFKEASREVAEEVVQPAKEICGEYRGCGQHHDRGRKAGRDARTAGTK